MIIKNGIIGRSENIVVALFGTGTIHIRNGFTPKEFGDVTFVTGEPKKIGEEWKCDESETWDNAPPEIIFRFTKTESIDVVIHKLNELKETMLSKEFINPSE